MSKIQKMTIKNFKSIDLFEANFNGCTAIITAGNNKGKTSFLKGIVDRIRFIRPDLMVKSGKTEGAGELILDDGSKFVWEFNNENKDTLRYITKDGIKANVTKELGAKFFPPQFDIDKFINSSPKEKTKQLQSILGIDFTEIDAKYEQAYKARATANIIYDTALKQLQGIGEVKEVKHIGIQDLENKKEVERSRLNNIYKENKLANETKRNEFNAIRDNIIKVNSENEVDIKIRDGIRADLIETINKLVKLGYNDNGLFDKWMQATYPTIEKKQLPLPIEPEYINEMPDNSELLSIEKQINEAYSINSQAEKYLQYIKLVADVEAKKQLAENANNEVKKIEQEKKNIINNAKVPDGIAFTDDGITIDGFVLEKTQISSSKLIIAALKIGMLGLGDVKTMYFDASYLDKNSLNEILKWAETQGLQLLIERPDFDGGEITYQLIETTI